MINRFTREMFWFRIILQNKIFEPDVIWPREDDVDGLAGRGLAGESGGESSRRQDGRLDLEFFFKLADFLNAKTISIKFSNYSGIQFRKINQVL